MGIPPQFIRGWCGWGSHNIASMDIQCNVRDASDLQSGGGTAGAHVLQTNKKFHKHSLYLDFQR